MKNSGVDCSNSPILQDYQLDYLYIQLPGIAGAK